jgi:hypothetical protein
MTEGDKFALLTLGIVTVGLLVIHIIVHTDYFKKHKHSKMETIEKKKKSWLRCFFGLHEYEIQEITDVKCGSDVIGKNYILRCSNCGKLRTHFVRTLYPYTICTELK